MNRGNCHLWDHGKLVYSGSFHRKRESQTSSSTSQMHFITAAQAHVSLPPSLTTHTFFFPYTWWYHPIKKRLTSPPHKLLLLFLVGENMKLYLYPHWHYKASVPKSKGYGWCLLLLSHTDILSQYFSTCILKKFFLKIFYLLIW